MKSSIRHFLVAALLTSIILLWIFTIIVDTAINHKSIRITLDKQLLYTGELIETLLRTNRAPETQHNINQIQYYHFQFQVINKDGKMILRSVNAPKMPYANESSGFFESHIDGKNWRIYVGYNEKNGDHIMVAGEIQPIEKLALQILKNNLIVMLIAALFLAMLIWFITQYSLRCIHDLSNALTNRAATHLEPIKLEYTPVEFEPLVKEMNNLFLHIRQAVERNKRFASDAAHELRTPLAALKTQAEVALKANENAERVTSLKNVIKGVNRSTHLVEQLLTLGRLGPEATLNDIAPVNLEKLAAEIVALLVPKALKKNIDIELIAEHDEAFVMANEISIAILMRNLVDNAIRYTPQGGTVKAYILMGKHHITFRVEDNGPGIPEALHDRIFERFFRVLGTKQTGSGLGLAIVKQIADLHKAHIILGTSESGRGLRFDVAFSKTNHR